jgi:ribosomal-protein-alanine N-acetyltransferase
MHTPILQTHRLYLRPFNANDVDNLFALDSNPDAVRFNAQPFTQRTQAQQVIDRLLYHYINTAEYQFWAAHHLQSPNDFMGWFCLKPLDNSPEIEIGYRLFPTYWNQGYATEGAQFLIHQHGFITRQLTRIVAVTHPENRASQRVLQKCGLQFEKKSYHYGTENDYFALNK